MVDMIYLKQVLADFNILNKQNSIQFERMKLNVFKL